MIKTCGGPHKATEFSYEGSMQDGFVIIFDSGNISLAAEFLQAIIIEFRGKMNFPRNNGQTERLGYNTTLKP